MNSFNHYSYGAIGDWMYRVVAGIDTYADAPGYKHIKIQPHLSDSLSYANADLKTYYGNVSSHWKRDGRNLQLDVEIPPNTTATLYIPTNSIESIKEGNLALASKGIKVGGKEGSYVIVEVGSGKYHFVSMIP
jgi:alpha-L-rhamnosidase